MNKQLKHVSVLLNEAIEYMNIKKNGIYIDGTFGGGGHSKLILSKLSNNGKLIAIDRDPKSILIANELKDPRLIIIHGNFSNINQYLKQFKLVGQVNGILLDLGMSSLQLEDTTRGFSFMKDGPLDMRMNPTCNQSASEWLLNATEHEIYVVLKNYGEERFAKRIANAIVKYNSNKTITRTKELVKIISSVIPIKYKFKHPATRTFQAIRIFINNELEELKIVLNNAVNSLALEGRLVIISFHSLEDRIVKQFMRTHSQNTNIPHGIPLTTYQLQELNDIKLKLLDKIVPNVSELIANPRARSAILRTAEKISLKKII
ncbi:MAG: 16S rRNA (cytosine(1402)-N(4))-methyltransferase RsmH [Pantoea sp. Brub]|nr:16S rRNA (cytosine(1402)-N(4))-methyltransferase RsmH [Pantoea sp. Brub]